VTEGGDGPGQEGDPPLAPVEKDDLAARPDLGQDQTRNTPSTAEVDQIGRWTGLDRSPRQHERKAVLDVVLDRPWTEEPGIPSLPQDGKESFLPYGLDHAGPSSPLADGCCP
jgi:hypothetical protein